MRPEAVTQQIRTERLVEALSLEAEGFTDAAETIFKTLYPNHPHQQVSGIFHARRGKRCLINNVPAHNYLGLELAILENLSLMAAETLRSKLPPEVRSAWSNLVTTASPVAISQPSATIAPETNETHQRSPNAQERKTTCPAPVLDVEAFLNPEGSAQSQSAQSSRYEPIKVPLKPQGTIIPDPRYDPNNPANKGETETHKPIIRFPTHRTHSTEHPQCVQPNVTTPYAQQNHTRQEDYTPTHTPETTHPTKGPVFPAPAASLIYALAGLLAEFSEFSGGYKYEEAKEIFFRALHPEYQAPPLQLKRILASMGENILKTIQDHPDAYPSELFEGPLKMLAMQMEEDDLAILEEQMEANQTGEETWQPDPALQTRMQREEDNTLQ